MSLLETSFLVHRLPPFHANVGKRLVKMPKPYFLDTGLACFLLGIRSADEVGVEVKSSSTVASDFFRPLNDVALEKGIVSAGGLSRRFLVYGGDDRQKRSDATVVPWSEVAGIAS